MSNHKLYPLISSGGDLVFASFNHVYNFLNENQWDNNLKSNQKKHELNSPKEELTWTIFCRIGIMVLFKEGLSLIIRRLSSNSNTNLQFLIQSNKWLLTALHLGLIFFLVNGGILICSLILTLRCITHSP